LLLAFVLAAVVVRKERAAAQLEACAVQRRRDDGLLVLRSALELLEERRLAVTRVAGDNHQRELAREYRRKEIAVERGFNVGLLADDVETAGARVASLALAVDRQQVAHVRIAVRRDRSSRAVVPRALAAVARPTPRGRHW